MKTEYLSIKEFALKAGVSPQAIYQRLDKDLKQFSSVINGKKMLNCKALGLFGFKEFEEFVNQDNSSNSSDSTLSALLKQLEIKDRQIEALTEALKNEQGLHAATAQQLKLLSGRSDPPQEEPKPEPEEERQPDPEAPAEPKTAPASELTAWELFKMALGKVWNG